MTAPNKRHVLLIEDATPLARVYQEYLRAEPYHVTHVETGREAFASLNAHVPEAILLDLKLPDMDGLDILRYVRERQMPTSVVVITAHGSINIAVEAMKEGAFDFIVKPFNADRLVYTLRNALERQHLTETVEILTEDFGRREFCGFIGASPPMQGVYRIIDSAAPSKATVFITGESGAGKEVCAEAIHLRSPRNGKPFVVLNCAAIPKDLMESEVFGHVKGAFTGAVADRQGAASLADGGTLFLDEICEMDIGLQAKLLRFVQTGSFQKVGSASTLNVDVRFLCASNRDPWEEVQAERFREDLFYRLHVIPLHLPPLRDREGDILDIARHFLIEFSTEEGKDFREFSPEAERSIADYGWPGNVRQLQNAIRNMVVLNNGTTITAEMLPDPIGGGRSGNPSPRSLSPNASIPPLGPINLRPLSEVEMDYINEALRTCDGNVPRAAAVLEISPSTIYRRIKESENS